jgi:hypothetical protein
MATRNEKRVVWSIGFEEDQSFFHLHCPAHNTNRLSLCEAAIELLQKAWPHLHVKRVLEDDLMKGDR